MRNLILTLFSFVVFSTALQAKSVFEETKTFQIARAVKIGRSVVSSDNTANVASSSYTTNEISINFTCGSTCKTCDSTARKCTQCNTGYYLNNDSCTVCPSNATCTDGKTFECYPLYYSSDNQCLSNCYNVLCLYPTYTEASANGCCCVW